MFSELITEIKAVLYERVASPLVATFSLSWAFINHKYLVVLVSSLSPEQKFSALRSLYPDRLGDFLRLYWGIPLPNLEELAFWTLAPGLATWVFLYKLPPLAKAVYRIHKEHQSELVKIRQELEDKELLTVEQSIELRARYKEMDKLLQEQAADYEALVKTLREQLTDAKDATSKVASWTSENLNEVPEVSSTGAAKDSVKAAPEERASISSSNDSNEMPKTVNIAPEGVGGMSAAEIVYERLRQNIQIATKHDDAALALLKILNDLETHRPGAHHSENAIRAEMQSKNFDAVITLHLLERLTGAGYLARVRDDERANWYTISPTGRELLLEVRDIESS